MQEKLDALRKYKTEIEREFSARDFYEVNQIQHRFNDLRMIVKNADPEYRDREYAKWKREFGNFAKNRVNDYGALGDIYRRLVAEMEL